MARVSKEANRNYQRQWYKKNKKKQMAKVARNKKKNTAKVREYKQNSTCAICSENHISTLVFHHRNPETKLYTISTMATGGWGWKTILEEIKKCDILCANCHRKLHHAQEANRIAASVL